MVWVSVGNDKPRKARASFLARTPLRRGFFGLLGTEDGLCSVWPEGALVEQTVVGSAAGGFVCNVPQAGINVSI